MNQNDFFLKKNKKKRYFFAGWNVLWVKGKRKKQSYPGKTLIWSSDGPMNGTCRRRQCRHKLIFPKVCRCCIARLHGESLLFLQNIYCPKGHKLTPDDLSPLRCRNAAVNNLLTQQFFLYPTLKNLIRLCLAVKLRRDRLCKKRRW